MHPPAPHPPPYAQGPVAPAGRPHTGAAVAVALVSCFVMPVVYIGLVFEVLGHRFRGGASFTPLGVAIAVGFVLWITALVLSIRAIVVSGRVGASRVGGVVALVASGVSVVTAGAAAAFSLLLLSGGGAHGRPLRVRGRPRTAPTRRDPAWSVDPACGLPDVARLTAEARARESARWTRDAREEHASIAAFARLSVDLLALGAPPALVEGAHRAALDEVLHARLAFALAGAYAGEPVGPEAWPEALEGEGPESPAGTLRRVARESLVDGAYGEGLAALRAAAEVSADPAVAAVLATLARDEAVHAALGWDVLAFCVARDGALAAELVEAAEALAARADAPLERAHAASVRGGLNALLAAGEGVDSSVVASGRRSARADTDHEQPTGAGR